MKDLLAIIEVFDGLCSLECAVGVPDTSSFVSDLLNRVWVGRICRGDVLYRTSLNTNNT